MVVRSKLFKSNRSQAVRLPKSVAFPEGTEEVEIVKSGNTLIISPVGGRWEEYFRNGPFVTEDFMQDRIDPLPEEREPF